MLCELVRAQTPDLVRLDGALFRAGDPGNEHVDAALLLPGLAGNFYSSKLIHSIARQLLRRGVHVLQANTRGHDGINWLSRAGKTEAVGAAFEIVDECRHDVEGWIQFLIQRGWERIAVVGHSLGAIKALYSQAYQPNRAVRCIAALSASRLNHDRFLQSTSAESFRRWLSQAQQSISDGNRRGLMRVDFPFPAFIAAETYMDKYGPSSRYDWTQFISRIESPVLLVFGEIELQESAAFQGIIDEIRHLQANSPRVQRMIIPEADHFYSGRRQLVSQVVGRWVGERRLD